MGFNSGFKGLNITIQLFSKGNTTVPGKVATTLTEIRHKQNTKTIQYKPKDEGTQDDRGRDGRSNFILRIKERETRLILHEHDDDDDDYGELSCQHKDIVLLTGCLIMNSLTLCQLSM